ncbi:MAG: hypothetical protein KGJ13_01700 [Patescibacteria group bacterium]|nr:hypothetical protein [Patescibacteria group bacterium]
MGTFPISFEARIRHGIFREALVRTGWTQNEAAAFLGVHVGTFNQWINLRKAPDKITPELEKKLFQLTGKLPEDIWPKEIFSKEFLARTKRAEVIRDIPVDHLLAPSAGIFALPPAPDDDLRQRELKEALGEIVSYALNAQEKRIMRAIFVDEKTLEQIGELEGLSGTRIGQIKDKILRRLRHPSIARSLRPYFDQAR